MSSVCEPNLALFRVHSLVETLEMWDRYATMEARADGETADRTRGWIVEWLSSNTSRLLATLTHNPSR